jgi:rod shape-determining protein MreC
MNRTAAASPRKPAWIALIAALVLHTGLISVQARHRFDTSFVRSWIMDCLAPVEKLADRSAYGLGYVWSRYLALVGVHDENERLRRENDTLRLRVMEQEESLLEARRLRALLELREPGLGKSVIARVIGRDPARSQTVTIDKGASHGVGPQAAVITSAGIVGRVIHSSNFFSIVQLIVDSDSAVGVMLQSTRRQGILKGNGRSLELDYIDDDNDLREGDTFLTSGVDRIYPKGFPVGVITSIGTRQGLFKSMGIRVAADLGRLEEVLCIVERPAGAVDSGASPADH